MSQIKAKHGVVYECYKGFTDEFGDRARVGQKFILEDDQPQELIDFNGYYVMSKASGRGTQIAAPIDNFASYFIPAAGQDEQTETEFKVGDRVKIKPSSEYYGTATANPAHIDGVITKIEDEYLGIFVDWDNETSNSYNDYDLVLAKQESYIDDNQLNQYSMKAIVVSSLEQIKELAKVSFLKDQIESEFPELFVTHKVGNRYKHSDGNRYILTGENSHVALTNLTTGMIESHTIRVDNMNNITADEFKQLCADTDKLTLISK